MAFVLVTCVLAAAVATTRAQDPAPIVDVRGQVVDRADPDQRARCTLWHDDMHRDRMMMVGETFAAADGRFRFADVPWFQRQQWGSNQFVLVARTTTKVGIVQLRGDRVATGDVRVPLRDRVDVRGRLVDVDSGEPIEGAWIWPSILGGTDNVWITDPLLPWRAETGRDGRFVLRGLPKGLSIRAIAGGPRHARTWLDLPAHDEPPAEHALHPGGSISGVVRRPDGTPAGRVRVVTSGNSEVGIAYDSTLTGDDGSFTLRSLGTGTYKVWAEVPDLTVVAAVGLRVQPHEALDDVVVRLVEGGFIVGRVVDAATGKPIVPGPQADVAMYGPARGPSGSCEVTPVRADGTFRIRAPAGENRIYLRGQPDGYGSASEVVRVIEGEQVEVVWKLDKPKMRKRAAPRRGGIGLGQLPG